MELEKYVNDVVNAIEREIKFRFQNLNKTVIILKNLSCNK
jgi:hypothetical protein